MVKSQRMLLVGMLVLACAIGALAAPRAHAAPAAVPGPWCGGPLWKLMTLSDTARSAGEVAPSPTSIADVAKVAAPAKVPAARTTPFQKQDWQVTAVVDQYRCSRTARSCSSVRQRTSTYMDAYMPNPKCLPKTARGRSQMLAARTALGSCPAPTGGWQPLGATVQVTGVGFWNPLHTTKGALPTGAELRPRDRAHDPVGLREVASARGRASSSRSTSSLVVYAAIEMRSRSCCGRIDGDLDAVLLPQRCGELGAVDVVGDAHARHLEHHLLGRDRLGAEHRAELAARFAARARRSVRARRPSRAPPGTRSPRARRGRRTRRAFPAPPCAR